MTALIDFNPKGGTRKVAKAGMLPIGRRTCCRNCLNFKLTAEDGFCARGNPLRRLAHNQQGRSACPDFTRPHIEGDDVVRLEAWRAHVQAVDVAFGLNGARRRKVALPPECSPSVRRQASAILREKVRVAIAEEGMVSPTEIAEKVGCTASVVVKHRLVLINSGKLPSDCAVRRVGIPSKVMRERVRAAIADDGMVSPTKIAEKVGCVPETVIKHRHALIKSGDLPGDCTVQGDLTRRIATARRLLTKGKLSEKAIIERSGLSRTKVQGLAREARAGAGIESPR